MAFYADNLNADIDRTTALSVTTLIFAAIFFGFIFVTAALVGFGILPLYQAHESGNVYQGFNTSYTCNVLSHSVSLSEDQQIMARKILRLIHGRN